MMRRKPAEIEPIEPVPSPAEPSNPDAPSPEPIALAPLEPLETDEPAPDGDIFQDAVPAPAIVAPEEPPQLSLEDEVEALKATCAALNAQIIALHGEGKHEEGDALRVKRMNVLAALKVKSNPLGYA